MLLQSIELKNFRQFINEKIDFSVDPDRNVTLIIGENGTGKTTFAQAFFWCLYGETDFTDKVLLNREEASNLLPDQNITVKVVLKLIHGSAGYEITRTQDYKKTYSNKIVSSNTVLNIAVKNAEGNTRHLKPLECETEIKKILPKELANYFFFDGERIEKMSKEIAGGKKSSGFSNAVMGLTGLQGILEALKHLAPTRMDSVMGKFNQSYVGGNAHKMQQLNTEIDSLQARLDRIKNRLEEIDDEINSAEILGEKCREDIKQYKEAEALQNEREKLTKELAAAKKMKSNLIKNACASFNDGMTEFYSMPLVKKALETLSTSDFSGKDIPEMHSKTIEFLLNCGVCICGTHLDQGTIPYQKVKELFEYLPPQSIGVTVGQFKKDSRNKFNKEVDLYQKILDQTGYISSQDDIIMNVESEISLITEKLGGEDSTEQVKKLNAQIKSYGATIKNLNDEKTRLVKEQGAKETEKSHKENTRSEMSLLDKNNQKIELYKAYTQRVFDELQAEYKNKEKEIRDNLQTSINEIFKTIYNGGLSLEIDEKYNVSVFVTDYEDGVETSTAQSISVIFAFITAIIKMAKDNQNGKSDVAFSEPYPLVMDAPLSAFDKRRIKAICEAIPETAEQVIIFIKDTDGELAEEHLGTKVMKKHYFEKIDEFHTKLI